MILSFILLQKKQWKIFKGLHMGINGISSYMYDVDTWKSRIWTVDLKKSLKRVTLEFFSGYVLM